MDNTLVKSIINEIREYDASEEEKAKIFKAKYPNFATKLPKLFVAACDSTFDLKYLDYMLKMADKLKENQMQVDEADKIVYDRLQSQFIPEKLRKEYARRQRLEDEKNRQSTA